MGKIDISNATRPARAQVGGSDRDRAGRFRKRMPAAARCSVYMRNNVLLPIRTPPVNRQGRQRHAASGPVLSASMNGALGHHALWQSI